jgi:Asp-tRNA(Asn)/Glu-tRNA(Gln) amidotransferase A subunit family amidase
MARNVADLRLLFHVLTGAVSEETQLKRTRFAWYTDDGHVPVTEQTANAVAVAASALIDAGLVGEERLPPHVDRGNELWLKLFSRASVVQLRKWYAGRESEGGSFVSWRLATADEHQAPTLDEYISN